MFLPNYLQAKIAVETLLYWFFDAVSFAELLIRQQESAKGLLWHNNIIR